jgi:hypothetical protein
MSAKGVSLIADLAAAYDPTVGVDKFTRQFVFTAPGEFLIEDLIKTARPQVITSYLHSDSSIVEKDGGFIFESGKPDLFAQILEPKSFDNLIEPNFLTAPGRPGSVDKGEREKRGIRLGISTKDKVAEAAFKVRLKIRP